MPENQGTRLVALVGLLAGSVFWWTPHGLSARNLEGAPPSMEEFPHRPSDRELQRTITQRLNDHDTIGLRHIEVEVREGRVTLNGIVHSEFEKTHAYFLSAVPGVRDIDNRLTVERPSQPDDEILRSKIEEALGRDERVAHARPRIEVKDRIVTLRGTVTSPASKAAAAEIVRQFPGVRRLHNYLEVRLADDADQLR